MRDAIADRSIDLVLIDPLSSYMPKADRNSEGDVRDALAPLQELMDQTGVAVLGIMHVGKGDGKRRAALRLLGSTAFVALARCVWMVHELPVMYQPDTNVGDDEACGIRKVLGVVKANYSLKPPALTWSRALDAPITWHGQSPIGIEEAFAEEGPQPAPKRAEAETFLRDLLKGGSKPAREIITAASDKGISENTLRAAATKVGIEKVKDGYQGSWLWSLPRDTDRAGGNTEVANDAKDANSPTRGPFVTFGREPHQPIVLGTPKDAASSLLGTNGTFDAFGQKGHSPSSEQETHDATWEDF